MSDALPYHKISLSEEMRLDIQWWMLYMRSFKGVDLIIDPGIIKFSYKGDACME